MEIVSFSPTKIKKAALPNQQGLPLKDARLLELFVTTLILLQFLPMFLWLLKKATSSIAMIPQNLETFMPYLKLEQIDQKLLPRSWILKPPIIVIL
jgi:hypothetical protein